MIWDSSGDPTSRETSLYSCNNDISGWQYKITVMASTSRNYLSSVCIITVRSVWTSSSPNRTNQQTNKHKKKQLDWTAAHRLIRYWTFLFLERYRLLLCLYRCRKLMKSPEEEKKPRSLFGSQTHSVTFLSECLSSHPSASLPLLCSKRCYKCPISHIWQDNRNQTQSD